MDTRTSANEIILYSKEGRRLSNLNKILVDQISVKTLDNKSSRVSEQQLCQHKDYNIESIEDIEFQKKYDILLQAKLNTNGQQTRTPFDDGNKFKTSDIQQYRELAKSQNDLGSLDNKKTDPDLKINRTANFQSFFTKRLKGLNKNSR